MKIFHIFYIIFIILIAVWQYYGRKLYYNNNEKNRKRYRVLKIILNFVVLICVVIGLFRLCSSEKSATIELSTSSFDFGSIQKDYAYLFTVVGLLSFVAIYFLSVRWLNAIKIAGEKTREFLQFLMHYAVVFVVMVLVLYIVKLEDSRESWQLGLFPILTVAFFALFYYFAPTFLLAYILYPFKFINKRSKFSKWLLIAVAAFFLICTGLFAIALSFSNM